jgi:hypothetical protein
MLSNGKTAMDAFSDNGVDGTLHLQALKPASSTSKTAIMEAARTPTEALGARGWDATDPCEGSKGRSHLPELQVRRIGALWQLDANGIAWPSPS